MTPRQKLAIAGVAIAGGIVAFFATTKTASAAPAPAPKPQPSSQPWPSDNMPWMMYSATTLARQRAYNAAVTAANTSMSEDEPPLFGRPYLAEDGVLGPDSCTQLSYWQSWGGPNVPIACRVGNI